MFFAGSILQMGIVCLALKYQNLDMESYKSNFCL